jgi:hypothetical protein
VRSRIVGVPEVPSRAGELRRRLAEMRAAAAAGQPVVNAVAAVAWDAESADRAVQDAMARLTEAYERRRELRGRLDGYRSMAAGAGLAEDIGLAELYQAARDPLWRGRCDPAVAAEAVARYAQAVHDKLDVRGGA